VNPTLTATESPGFLKLLAHDLRWNLVTTLARSDYRVYERVDFLEQPPNLVSYHLKRLRAQGLVRERRSGADARDVYYSFDHGRLRHLYFSAGRMLHPCLGEPGSDANASQRSLSRSQERVLFLCTENSARSQMAEAILRHMSRGRVEAFSAGTCRSGIHPLAVATMQRHHIDISQQRSKHLDEFQGQSFTHIITLCDRAREVCPTFPGDPARIHWSVPNPAGVEGDEAAKSHAFAATAQELMTRIRYLLLMLERSGGAVA
jgi:protein-tyrosine-phosphatase